MLNPNKLPPLPDLAREGATTLIEIEVMPRVMFNLTVAEIVNQLFDGMPHLEADDYTRIEALAVQARKWREQKQLDAMKQNPLYAGLMEAEA